MKKFKHIPVTKSDEMIAERLEAIYEELHKINKRAEEEAKSIIASVPSEDVQSKVDKAIQESTQGSTQKRKK